MMRGCDSAASARQGRIRGRADGPWARGVGWGLACLIVLSLAACDNSVSGDGGRFPSLDCAIPTEPFLDGGVGRDGIPALTIDPSTQERPEFVDPGQDGTAYLQNSSRVIGLTVAGQAYAVPHNILWWHEIANLNLGEARIAVTYCPLTGSSMAFDRAVIGGGEFRVSGLLFRNNLTMFDNTSQESLWPQMNRTAGCGPRTGTAVTMVPVVEMRWDGWQTLHPNTKVVSSNTRIVRDYTRYPYGDYEVRSNTRLLDQRTPIDDRRPPKERVLGLPDGEGGVAFPFGALDEGEAPMRVVEETVGGEPVVIFWDSARRGAMAYRSVLDGQPLTFEVREGEIVDVETESTWRVDGVAASGPRAGTRLEPVADAYVAFWFAWATFQPETRLWEGT